MESIKIHPDVILGKIYLIRGKKVMIDRDLAALYEVETKQLKRSVRRNIERFPDDFMFEMTKEELENWRYQIGTSNKEVLGLRILPFAFTESGVIMLASILNSERAIQVNIQIVRIFTRMREMLNSHQEILQKLEKLDSKDVEQDEKIALIFKYLKQLEQSRRLNKDFKNRKRIGYKQGKKEI